MWEFWNSFSLQRNNLVRKKMIWQAWRKASLSFGPKAPRSTRIYAQSPNSLNRMDLLWLETEILEELRAFSIDRITIVTLRWSRQVWGG